MKDFGTVKNDLSKYAYVAIGNWSNNSKVKSAKGPTCELKNYLVQNGVRLIEIDELNLFSMCWTWMCKWIQEFSNSINGIIHIWK